MKTKLNFYRLNARDAEPLEKKLYKLGLVPMKSPILPGQAMAAEILNGKEILLNTERLFRNAWQTEAGYFFDWQRWEDKKQIAGIWLEPTNQMGIERCNRFECGYCLYQYKDIADILFLPAGHMGKYCKRCLGDHHLKTDLLPLLRLQPMNAARTIDAQTDPELLRLYTERQEQERQLRFERMKLAELTKLNAEKLASDIEYKGKTHLLNLGIELTGIECVNGVFKFTLGLSRERAQEINSKLKEASFAYPYELQTLENVRATDGTFKQRLTRLIDSFNE